jgi:hypothetical protein
MDDEERNFEEEERKEFPEIELEHDVDEDVRKRLNLIRKRLGAVTRTPTRYETLQAEITRLSNSEFTIKEFYNHELINGLFLIVPEVDILEETRRRVQKWVSKRGRNLGSLAYHNFIASQMLQATITFFLRQIRPFTKMKGSDLIMPQSFSHKLIYTLKKKPLPEWQQALEQEINFWHTKHKTPKEDLRVYAHLIAKLLTRKA